MIRRPEGVPAPRQKRTAPLVSFRDDDVNILSPELADLVRLFQARDVPISLAVEPGNLQSDTAVWLRDLHQSRPDGIEIVQHGWRHIRYETGEFDRSRSFRDQKKDLAKGKNVIQSAFGSAFFPMIVFPYNVFTADSLKAADELGFAAFSAQINPKPGRQLFDRIARNLRLKTVAGRRIQRHLEYHPGTRLLEIGSAVSFEAEYSGHASSRCEHASFPQIERQIENYLRVTDVLVFVIHHRCHPEGRGIRLISDTLDLLAGKYRARFSALRAIHALRAPAAARNLR